MKIGGSEAHIVIDKGISGYWDVLTRDGGSWTEREEGEPMSRGSTRSDFDMSKDVHVAVERESEELPPRRDCEEAHFW